MTTGIGWSAAAFRRRARGERRVVGEDGAGADDDRVVLGAAAVHVGPRGGAGDPLARAVGRRDAAVEALTPTSR